jgi:hypothetical protein
MLHLYTEEIICYFMEKSKFTGCPIYTRNLIRLTQSYNRQEWYLHSTGYAMFLGCFYEFLTCNKHEASIIPLVRWHNGSIEEQNKYHLMKLCILNLNVRPCMATFLAEEGRIKVFYRRVWTHGAWGRMFYQVP